MKVEMIWVEKLIPYARNPRHNDAAVDAVAASIKEFGFRQPIVVDEDMVILVGHTRLKAAHKLGMAKVPVHIASGLTDAQRKAYRIADNRLIELAEWDNELLALELEELRMADFDLDTLAFDEGEIEALIAEANATNSDGANASGNLAARFGCPPFSVLNARAGWWQDRKRAWLALGIRSELGRGEDLAQLSSAMALMGAIQRRATPGGSAMPAMNYGKTKKRGDGRGRAIND